MKKKRIGVLIGTLWWAGACGAGDDESASPEGDGGNSGGESGVVLVVEEITFDLDSDRALSSLADSEIRSACDEMAAVFQAADAGVACQIVASSESTTAECESRRDECLEDPADALQQTTVRSTPAPVDCAIFEASLTEGCDYPVSLLEDCVNALAQSVVPAAQAIHCDEAAEIEDIEQAHATAVSNLNTDYASICFDLLECEDLVGALLSGESSTGVGGAREP